MIHDLFHRWWNSLAERNGKLKFRSRRDAEEFVRSVANRSGGPNRAMIQMRREYLAIQEKKRFDADSAKSEQRSLESVQ